MDHLVIGAAEAAHVREYARSWELATSVHPTIWSWHALCAEPESLSLVSDVPLPIRLCAPTGDELTALASLGGAPKSQGDVEAAPAALLGMTRALSRLEDILGESSVAFRHATPPKALCSLLDRSLFRKHLLEMGEGQKRPLPLPLEVPGISGVGKAHESYERLREQLRTGGNKRILIRQNRYLQSPSHCLPAALVWLSGRGIRGLANCRFTDAGATRCEVHTLTEESALRPLLGRLFELGATVEEEWQSAEIAGHSFLLSLLVVGHRVVLGFVGEPSPFRVRGTPPEPGVPTDLATVRRHIGRDLYQRMEELCVRLCNRYAVSGLVLDLAISRRFDEFVILAVDPFAEMPLFHRDAVGWSGADHLVRRVRTLLSVESDSLDPKDVQPLS